jgi:glycosyltransferase involved in cell wall biosynthesis
MSKELISVIIPVYNPDVSFPKTIRSVLNQTYKNFELIIMDDGSDIDIIPILSQFNDQRIIYKKLEHKNANVARNQGISTSNGKYIAMLDSDDLWLDNHLNDCLNTLQKSNAHGLYGSLLLRDTNGQERPFHVRKLNKDERMINYLLKTGYGAQTSTLFLTTQSAKEILWDPSLNRHQDYDFIVRYDKKYQLIPKENPTVIYVCTQKKTVIDFKSCINFIKSNKNDIEPQLYISYNSHMLMLAKNRNATNDIIKYYIKEATRYKEYLSYFNYAMIRYPQTRIERFKCKIAYIFHIIKTKIE